MILRRTLFTFNFKKESWQVGYVLPPTAGLSDFFCFCPKPPPEAGGFRTYKCSVQVYPEGLVSDDVRAGLFPGRSQKTCRGEPLGHVEKPLVRSGIVVKIPRKMRGGFFSVRGILVTCTKMVREFQFPNQLSFLHSHRN